MSIIQFFDVEDRRNVDPCEKCVDDFSKYVSCECLENNDCDPTDHLPERCFMCELTKIIELTFDNCKAIKGE